MKKKKRSQQRIPINEYLSSVKTEEDVEANPVSDLIKAIEVRKKMIIPSYFLTKKED